MREGDCHGPLDCELEPRLTVAEAARLARCSKDTIRRAYWSGCMQVERLGPQSRRVRIRRTEVERWLAAGSGCG